MNLKKYLPTREQLRETKTLRILGEVVFEENLWHTNRHSVSYAALVGIFCCFLPIPFQMFPCTLLCIWLRCNIPIAVLLVWISNPITIPPMFYLTYRLGTWVLGEPVYVEEISLSWDWLSEQISLVWQPLVLGSLLTGITLGVIAFLSVRIYWRWRISRYWKSRQLRQPKTKGSSD